jgi:hypothetical protein
MSATIQTSKSQKKQEILKVQKCNFKIRNSKWPTNMLRHKLISGPVFQLVIVYIMFYAVKLFF